MKFFLPKLRSVASPIESWPPASNRYAVATMWSITASCSSRETAARSGNRESLRQHSARVTPAASRVKARSWWTSSGQQRVWGAIDSTQPLRASSISATACATAATSSQKNFMVEGRSPRRPVRPMRCKNEETVAGALAWSTRSRSPMSIPSSRVEVQTIAALPPA